MIDEVEELELPWLPTLFAVAHPADTLVLRFTLRPLIEGRNALLFAPPRCGRTATNLFVLQGAHLGGLREIFSQGWRRA